jgi:Flp pilus assembly pilin Flp
MWSRRGAASGQGLVEYGLILLLVALVVVVALPGVAAVLNGAFQQVVDSFP